jgi:DNA polymerase III subunit beta
MFSLRAKVSELLQPLQQVIGIVERRHTLPILSNILLEARDGQLLFIATDLEVQVTAIATIAAEGAVTVAARKLHDILRALPGDADAVIEDKDGRVVLKAAKSRFNLQTLPAADYPRIAMTSDAVNTIELKQSAFKEVLTLTQFAMAVQDIRYYLNGLLVSVANQQLRLVATDGHRLALATVALPDVTAEFEAILPRKTVLELVKLLGDEDAPVRFVATANQVRFNFGGIDIISKIVEGKFPDYNKVIPQHHSNHVLFERIPLLQSLQRAAILSSTEKIRSVRLVLTTDQLAIICSNAEQEEAEEIITVAYQGAPLDIGFNIAYLLDVLNTLETRDVEFVLGESTSSALIRLPERDDYKYVVMPMRM